MTSVFWYHHAHRRLSQDDLNDKLRAKIKELEDAGARLQKTVNIQKVQIEKHRASADESSRICGALRREVCALKKVRRDKNSRFSMGRWKDLTLELLGCAGARRSEKIPQTGGKQPEQHRGASEPSAGGGGEVKDSNQPNGADEHGEDTISISVNSVVEV